MLAEGLLPMALQFTGNILCGVVTGLQKEQMEKRDVTIVETPRLLVLPLCRVPNPYE